VTSTLSEDDLLARRLPVGGTHNVREVGGYLTATGEQIAWGRLLRGDALHTVDDKGRELLREFGLRTCLDLREEDERRHSPDLLDVDVRLVHVPLFTYRPPHLDENMLGEIDRSKITSLAETYRYLVVERGAVLVCVIRELLAPGALPAIVHCTAGKDRTGLTIALLLSALGVPDETIAADFAATSIFLDDAFFAQAMERGRIAGMDTERMAAMFICPPELILGALAVVRESYGSVVEYLKRHGLTEEELATLRDALLVSGPVASDGQEGAN
jgi:protein-tyrosine phosphatase